MREDGNFRHGSLTARSYPFCGTVIGHRFVPKTLEDGYFRARQGHNWPSCTYFRVCGLEDGMDLFVTRQGLHMLEFASGAIGQGVKPRSPTSIFYRC